MQPEFLGGLQVLARTCGFAGGGGGGGGGRLRALLGVCWEQGKTAIL